MNSGTEKDHFIDCQFSDFLKIRNRMNATNEDYDRLRNKAIKNTGAAVERMPF